MILNHQLCLTRLLPNDPREAASVRRRSTRFYYNVVVKKLYRRPYDGILLCCLSNSEAQEVIKEDHDGICGAHHSGPKLKDRLHRLGYYWLTMMADAVEYAKRCKACQIHADFVMPRSHGYGTLRRRTYAGRKYPTYVRQATI